MAQQEQQSTFQIKSNPIECPCWGYDDEDWSCEHCSGEGENKICTFKPEYYDPYGFEDPSEKSPCWFWRERLEDGKFITPLKSSIFDSSGRKIGELSGWLLNPDMIIYDERGSFFVLDGVSALLMYAHGLIIREKYLFCRTGWLGDIPFITRLSLYDEFRSLELEQEILTFLLKGYGAMIYSLGYTELDDDDFFDYQDDEWESYWEEKLWELGWLPDKRLWYAFDHKQHLFKPDPILFGEE